MRDIFQSAETASKKMQRIKLIAAFITLCLTLAVTILVSDEKRVSLDVTSKIGSIKSSNDTHCFERAQFHVSDDFTVTKCKQSNVQFIVLCSNASSIQCMWLNKNQWNLLKLKRLDIDTALHVR